MLKQFIDVKKLLKTISEYDVLVGIPDETTHRKSSNEVTNAELAFLHTNGVTKHKERKKIEAFIEEGYNYQEARKHVHELHIMRSGSPAWSIPPRPIIEPAIEDSKEVISKLLRNALGSFLKCEFDEGERKLRVTGMKAQNVVRAWFVNPKNNWAPNSPMTIALKGSARPLINTGEMRKSITYVVKVPKGKYIKRLKNLKKEELT